MLHVHCTPMGRTCGEAKQIRSENHPPGVTFCRSIAGTNASGAARNSAGHLTALVELSHALAAVGGCVGLRVGHRGRG